MLTPKNLAATKNLPWSSSLCAISNKTSLNLNDNFVYNFFSFYNLACGEFLQNIFTKKLKENRLNK